MLFIWKQIFITLKLLVSKKHVKQCKNNYKFPSKKICICLFNSNRTPFSPSSELKSWHQRRSLQSWLWSDWEFWWWWSAVPRWPRTAGREFWTCSPDSRPKLESRATSFYWVSYLGKFKLKLWLFKLYNSKFMIV